MSVPLSEFLKAIDMGESGHGSLYPLLRQLATEVCEVREGLRREVGAARDANAAICRRLDNFMARCDSMQSQINANDQLATALARRVASLDERDDAQMGVNVTLGARLEKLEHPLYQAQGRPIMDHEQTNTVSYGKSRFPSPLPKWNACTVVRGANAVFVSAGREGPLDADAGEVYSFDDFETAGRFVAAVLTQERPR